MDQGEIRDMDQGEVRDMDQGEKATSQTVRKLHFQTDFQTGKTIFMRHHSGRKAGLRKSALVCPALPAADCGLCCTKGCTKITRHQKKIFILSGKRCILSRSVLTLQISVCQAGAEEEMRKTGEVTWQ